jgi:hypothetical protein
MLVHVAAGIVEGQAFSTCQFGPVEMLPTTTALARKIGSPIVIPEECDRSSADPKIGRAEGELAIFSGYSDRGLGPIDQCAGMVELDHIEACAVFDQLVSRKPHTSITFVQSEACTHEHETPNPPGRSHRQQWWPTGTGFDRRPHDPHTDVRALRGEDWLIVRQDSRL